MHSLKSRRVRPFHPKVSTICCIRVTSVCDALPSCGKGAIWERLPFIETGLGTWGMDVEAWILCMET